VLLGTYLGTHRELEKTHWALEENILGTLKAPKTTPRPSLRWSPIPCTLHQV